MNRHFAESFLNREDHRVLGLPLRPLSLWHMFNLEVAQSPYFTAASFPAPKDLRLAVNVCRSSFPKLPDLSCTIWEWLKCWRCEFFVESVKFRTYLADFNALPQLWQADKPTTAGRPQTGLPWSLAIVASVCGSTGWDETKVWNMPIGQAYWYHVAFAMQKGSSVDLLSEGELLAIETVRARRAGK
jgi:hypothetical protein